MPTTKVGSHTLYYDEHGKGQPLLLIAGLGETRLSWWKQIEPLSQMLHVINLDNRDAGDSTLGSAPYTIAEMADDVAGVLQNLNLGSVHVVGWSMGGFIALELAIRNPALVQKLILVSTSAGGPTSVHAAPEISALLLRKDGEEIEPRVRRIFPLLTRQGYMLDHPEDLDQLVHNAQSKPMAIESYKRQLRAVMKREGVSHRLTQITAPTLVIHGNTDPLIPYENGQYITEHIPDAKLSTFAGVGHLVPIEAADRFNREVMEFVN
jgi:pimeloyl-ACP methyl ester carboxylesterase